MAQTDMVEGGLWKHYKGGLYRVIGRGRHHHTGDVYIMYTDIGTGRNYVRAEAEWHELMKINHGDGFASCARFLKVGT